jgi:hypothetical protein
VNPAEQLIRELVARTGEPVLFRPPSACFRLHVIALNWLDDAPEGIWTLFIGREPETDDDWEDALAMAYSAVCVCDLGPIEGVTVNTTARRIECSTLGLSLLQLALNSADCGFTIHLWSEWA